MAAVGAVSVDFTPEPDLHPLYPTPGLIDSLLSSHSGLSPTQKHTLVSHCLTRACVFGDISVLQHLLHDRQAQAFVDLSIRDDDGVGLVSLAIHGFGAESDRDVDREECVRLLVSQGADLGPDTAGWTPLHYAALLSPPTLITYLMTNGCSLFDVTQRNLTPLDIVTAHSVVPGREDIVLLLVESMRGEGWKGGRMEERRRVLDERLKKQGRQKTIRDGVGRVLGVHGRWWGKDPVDLMDSDDEDEDDEQDEKLFTPPPEFSSMLVFSPPLLPQIFDSLISNYPPTLHDAKPANTLYLLARFAAVNCDHTWLEDLVVCAVDAIEETFYSRSEDLTCLVFWLYNTTIWLHLMQCDNLMNETCEVLGSLVLLEEVINSILVFIIRFIERRIDLILDSCILDYSPIPGELEAVQFESEWSFLRSFTGKKKNTSKPSASTLPHLRNGAPTSPTANRPPSPSSLLTPGSATGKSFSLRTYNRARSTTPLQSLFPDSPPPPSPAELTAFITAVHTLLTLSDINPVLITQLWSQIMYWTSCEIFNRILTRKKYLCRSRAHQVALNVEVIEDWVLQMELPAGVKVHFTPVKDLLTWLQCLSSVSDFPNLVATIQSLKNINPLQMRRAVRDYRYEVDESKMEDECVQYLTQLQKDWERHRVKLGLEALRKEQQGDRDRGRDDSSSISSVKGRTPSISSISSTESIAQRNIDMLFDRNHEKSTWEPVKPPKVLGELLDSRHMLPLYLPSDPRLLAAVPGMEFLSEEVLLARQQNGFVNSMQGPQGPMSWKPRSKSVREVGADTLGLVDGIRSASRWGRPLPPDPPDQLDHDEEEKPKTSNLVVDVPPRGDQVQDDLALALDIPLPTPLTRKPSTRAKRPSHAGELSPTDWVVAGSS